MGYHDSFCKISPVSPLRILNTILLANLICPGMPWYELRFVDSLMNWVGSAVRSQYRASREQIYASSYTVRNFLSSA